ACSLTIRSSHFFPTRRSSDLKGGITVSDIIVLKCGGSTVDELSNCFFENIATLKKAGLKPVIVHGGGPAIKEMLTKLDIKTEFIDGLRKTTEDVMDVVEMILTGTINNSLTKRLNDSGIKSVGISGADADLLTAKAIHYERYGLVGDITNVNEEFIHQLLELDIVPVIAPIALSEDGSRFNINADTAAGAVARSLNAKQLIFVTDVPGIMHQEELLEFVTEQEVEELIQSGIIYGGMIPKVQAAIASLNTDLHEVAIVNGKDSSLRSSTSFVGTIIRKTVEVNQS